MLAGSRMGRQKRRSSLSFGSINGTPLRRSQPSASSFTTKGRKRPGMEDLTSGPRPVSHLSLPSCADVRLPPLFSRLAHRRFLLFPNSLIFETRCLAGNCTETSRQTVLDNGAAFSFQHSRHLEWKIETFVRWRGNRGRAFRWN